MAISNELLVTFNYPKIDEKYDFYIITTSDKYISNGAYVLDKPIETLKAESVVFDNGRSLFLMFNKNCTNRIDLAKQIEDEKLSLKQVYSDELKDYILFRLFLFSLNNFNFEENKFNNITGKLFITNPSWMAKNRNTFKALNINVDSKMNVIMEASTFTKSSLFQSKKIQSEYPRYSFSNKNCGLKRVLRTDDEETYIRKSLYGIKAEIPFFEFSQKKIKKCKVFYLYHTLDILKEKFNNLLDFDFKCINIFKTIGRSRNDKIDEYVNEIVSFKSVNLVNWSNSIDYDDEFKEIVNLFTGGKIAPVTEGKTIEKGLYNVVYLHNKDYYEQHKYNDPYKNFPINEVIQHITIEDSADKIIDNNIAIYNTILKELLIKDDIINNKKMSLDNWESFGFDGDYVFGKEKDGVHYFITIKRNGSFMLYNKTNNLTSFGNKMLDECSDYLTDNKGKEKTIIADPKGNVIVISRTSTITLPNKKVFSLEEISRSKDSREELLSGVVDINLYEIDKKMYYSVGIQGYGMQTSIPKAAHLYQVDVVKGQNFIEAILETMAVSFVKYKSFTVMPYPIKYLNEYILMCEANKDNKKQVMF